MASALEGCVASLRGSMQNLDSTINILDDGVSDMPRLAKVLQTTRVWIHQDFCDLHVRSVLTAISILNLFPKPTSKPRNPHSSQKSVLRSTIY